MSAASGAATSVPTCQAAGTGGGYPLNQRTRHSPSTPAARTEAGIVGPNTAQFGYKFVPPRIGYIIGQKKKP